MGQIGSRVFNTLTKDIRNFNIENRVHRVISKEKPTPAPRYPADERELDRIAKEHPDVVDRLKMKNSELDDRLKKVFVTSHDQEHNMKSKQSETRPLPVNRVAPEQPEFGFLEPANIAAGKISFRQAIALISNHQEDPEKWSKDILAKEFKLSSESVENILEHFRPLQFTINKNDEKIKVAAPVWKRLSQ